MAVDPHPDDSAGGDPRVAAAVLEYLEAQDKGTPIEPDVWLSNCLEALRSELRDFLAGLDVLRSPSPANTARPDVPGSASNTRNGFPQIEGYQVERELGHGGFAVVYLAREVGLDRRVAIKMLHSTRRHNPLAAARFEDEARAISRFDHDHIIKILRIGRHDGSLFLVLEYLEGGTLQAKLSAQSIDDKEIARIAISLADGLELAHASGVIHRDLKPANVLFDRAGRPKISDFGLARLGEGIHTQSGDVFGSPSYMSPEQAAGKSRELTHATDIYSLGAILYEMLTGRVPFEGSTPQSVINKVLQEVPKPIHKLNQGASKDLITICEKCLERSPTARFPRAGALRDELRRFLNDEPLTIKPATRRERLVKWSRRKPILATAYGLALLAITMFALTTGATWLWRRAETARGQLEIEQKATAKARDDANIQRVIAERARDEADRLKKLADEQRIKRFNYQHLTATQLVPRFWQEGRHFDMPPLLAELIPQEGEDDLRGFEWHYWRRLTNDLRLIQAHTGTILTLTVSPDGKIFATAGADREVKLWDLTTGRLLRTFTGHEIRITAVAFSPDSKRIASVSSDLLAPNAGGELRIWDVADGRVITSSRIPRRLLLAATYSPDGRNLITGGARATILGVRGEVTVWDPETARQEQVRFRPNQLICAVAFSPDGSRLASGGSPGPNGAGEVRLWSTSDWRDQGEIGKHDKGVWSLAFTPNGDRLVTTGISTTVRVWNVASRRETTKLDGHTRPIARAALSPDGKRLATMSFDSTTKLWDLEQGKELITLRGHAGFVYGGAFGPDGRQLITAGLDGTVRFWDGTAGQRYVRKLPAQKAEFAMVAFSPDGRSLAWISGKSTGSGQLGVWDVKSGKSIFVSTEERLAYLSVAFSPDGRHLAVGTGERGRATGVVKLCDSTTGRTLRELEGHAGAVDRLVYSQDGRRLITGGQDALIMIWDTETFERLAVLRSHRLKVFALALSRDGLLLASGAGVARQPGSELKLWHPESGELLHSFDGLDEGVTDLVFSPDGARLAAGSFGEIVRIWDVEKRVPILKLAHAAMAVSVAYSPDGRRLATGSFDGTITIWEARTGDNLLTLTNGAMPVVSLAFSADGLRLASAGGDGEVRIWDATSAASPR